MDDLCLKEISEALKTNTNLKSLLLGGMLLHFERLHHHLNVVVVAIPVDPLVTILVPLFVIRSYLL